MNPHLRPILRLLPLALATALLPLAVGCGGGGAGGPPPDVAVEVVLATPTLETVEDLLTAVGTIEANERVELKPKASGIAEAIHFAEGQRIEAGAKLLELDSRKECATVAQARAEEDLARANVARARTLAGTRAISQQELDQLESQLAVRTAARQLQEEQLAERTLFAPIGGTLGPRLVSPGQYLATGTPIGTLVDDAQVKVHFRIPERELSRVRLGQEGRLRVAAHPQRVFAGKVDLIDPEIDPSTRTVLLRLLVPNPEALLRAGMFARVEVVALRRPNALVIPEAALVPSLDRFSVFVDRQGRAASQPVTIGVRLPGKVEILDGLTPDTSVVTSGTQKLVEGMKLAAAPVAPATAPTAPPPPTTTSHRSDPAPADAATTAPSATPPKS